MFSTFTNLVGRSSILRRFEFYVGIWLLLVLCNLHYDSQSGWTYRNYPLDRPVLQVTREQALSLIDEKKIKAYGVRRGQLVMLSTTGKWFSLQYLNNQELLRPLGQSAAYIAYYDRYRHWY